jgi:copper chaperone CopZ
MKFIIAIALSAFVFMSFTSEKKTKVKSQFTVYGICGMCETTIEKTLNNRPGVLWADWELETLVLTVKYDSDVISLDRIKQKLAEAGYDSETHRATDEAYENLHACCKYERPKK